jgi:cytochrome c oxidase assembly protein subunit 15
MSAIFPWPHRLAWAVACGVFPLIWMGGLVTTKGAGMAVPDWPTTYESWFYPLQKWIWKTSSDLFLEHGHRTLAQVVGLFAIFLLISVFRHESRKSVRLLAVAILVGLLFQGTLGGFRVLWDERLLARIHGCTAPIVFCLCAVMVTLTSKTWRFTIHRECKVSAELPMDRCQPATPATRPMPRPALLMILSGLVYLEIVFGTLLRHPLIDAWTSWSLVWIWSKVITVGLLFLGILYLVISSLFSIRRKKQRDGAPPKSQKIADGPSLGMAQPSFYPAFLRKRIFWFASLFLLQVVLACTTWVANYGWPKWFADNIVNWNYTVARGGLLQVWITTAHAAVGSLVLVSAVTLTLWSRRIDNRRKEQVEIE